MQNNKPNELCSDTKQALLDLIASADDNGNLDLREKLKEALDLANASDYIHADEKYKAHKYPDSVVTWFKRANAISNEQHAVTHAYLSANANWLLDFMEERMTQRNEVELSRESVMQYDVLNKNSYPKAIKELMEKGRIQIAKGHSKGSATTYRIISDDAWYSNFSNREYFEVAENENGQPVTILDSSKGVDQNVVTAFRKDENGKVHRVNKILAENA